VVGFSLYVLNLLVGLAAQLRLAHFGLWHHGLYLLVFISTLAALVYSKEWWLLLTVACLTLFFLKPGPAPGSIPPWAW
jgi:hypothetical protein